MIDAIVPFRSKSDDASGLARVDLIAVEFLASGRAQNLTAARLEAILAELRLYRVQLCASMEDQRALNLAGQVQFAPLAETIASISDEALTQIDQLIQHAELAAGIK